MRTVSFLGFVLLSLVGSACGAKVVVDTPGEGGGGGVGGGSSSTGPSGCMPSAELCNGVDDDCNDIVDDPPVCDTPCVGCADFITLVDPSLPLCPGSQPIYDALFGCLCAGPCAVSCSASFCVGSDPAESCITCANDFMGCSNELGACGNDI